MIRAGFCPVGQGRGRLQAYLCPVPCPNDLDITPGGSPDGFLYAAFQRDSFQESAPERDDLVGLPMYYADDNRVCNNDSRAGCGTSFRRSSSNHNSSMLPSACSYCCSLWVKERARCCCRRVVSSSSASLKRPSIDIAASLVDNSSAFWA